MLLILFLLLWIFGSSWWAKVSQSDIRFTHRPQLLLQICLTHIWPHICIFQSKKLQRSVLLSWSHLRSYSSYSFNEFRFVPLASHWSRSSSSVPEPLLVFLRPDMIIPPFSLFSWYDYLVQTSIKSSPFSPYFPFASCLWPSGAGALYPHRSFPWRLNPAEESQPTPGLY